MSEKLCCKKNLLLQILFSKLIVKLSINNMEPIQLNYI